MQKSNKVHIAEKVSPACFGKSVLLIDTDTRNHLLHRMHLKKYKLDLICTKSLRHAIWLANEQPPDLILTEIYFNGYLHYDHLFWLRMEKFMPIIVQTSQPVRYHRENCNIRGAEAFFCKPLDWKSYMERIENCLLKRER